MDNKCKNCSMLMSIQANFICQRCNNYSNFIPKKSIKEIKKEIKEQNK